MQGDAPKVHRMQGCAAGKPGTISCQNTHHQPAPIRSPKLGACSLREHTDVAAGRGYAFVQIRMHTTLGLYWMHNAAQPSSYVIARAFASGAPTPPGEPSLSSSTAAPPNLTIPQRGWDKPGRPDLRPSGSSWFVLGDQDEGSEGAVVFFYPLMTGMSGMAFSVRAGAAVRLLAPELVDII